MKLSASINPFSNLSMKKKPTIAVIKLEGVIMDSGSGQKKELNLRMVQDVIDKAFMTKTYTAIAFVINSPGGSPSQSAILADYVMKKAKESEKKTYCFVEDVAASGGYWLACMCDEIYADASSIVGSIGVIGASFGFADALDKLGVERRVHTAGDNKSLSDPFLPEKKENVERLKVIQQDIHDNFIEHVQSRRPKTKDVKDVELFDGSVFTGRRALDLGLIDGVGHLHGMMKEKYGENVVIKYMNKIKKNPLLGRMSIIDSFVERVIDGVHYKIQEIEWWGRY